ncbi:hypothetical protein JCM14124_24070 [Humidesulfovibrio idahonensis]
MRFCQETGKAVAVVQGRDAAKERERGGHKAERKALDGATKAAPPARGGERDAARKRERRWREEGGGRALDGAAEEATPARGAGERRA